jgi:hypothetical protein
MRYSKRQMAVFRFCWKHRRSCFDLAGHWLLDLPVKGASRIARPSFTAQQESLIRTAWRLAQDEARLRVSHRGGYSWLCEVMVSQIVFPRDFDEWALDIFKVACDAGFGDVARDTGDPEAWAKMHLPYAVHSPVYGALFSSTAMTCMRLMRDESLAVSDPALLMERPAIPSVQEVADEQDGPSTYGTYP